MLITVTVYVHGREYSRFASECTTVAGALRSLHLMYPKADRIEAEVIA